MTKDTSTRQRVQCQKCGQRFWRKPGHIISHSRRQGCVTMICEGKLEPIDQDVCFCGAGDETECREAPDER